MEFLRAVPALELTDEGSKYSTFFAEVLGSRPAYKEICESRQRVLALETAFGEALQKSVSGIKSVFVFIDAVGMFMVVTFGRRVSTSHAKTHTDFVVRALDKMQRRLIEKTLRACDELDKDRIMAMTTIQECRPKRAAQPDKVRRVRAPPQTLAALMDSLSSSEEEAETRLCVRAPSALQVFQMQPRSASARELAESSARIRLQKEADRITEELSTQCDHDSWLTTPLFGVELGGDAPECFVCHCHADVLFKCKHCRKLACDPCRLAEKTSAERDDCATARDAAMRALQEFDEHVAQVAWAEQAEDNASIKVAGVGKQKLTYVRIYKPERRLEVLRKRLPKGAGLIETVRIAKGLLEAGALHKMSLETRSRKSEFLRLCGEALKLADPDAETNPKQLTPLQQARLAMLLDTTMRTCHRCGKVAKDPLCLEDLADKFEWRHDGDEGFSWPELLRAKFACRGICADRAWVKFCENCGGEEAVPGGPGNVLVKCALCSGRMRRTTPLHVQRKKQRAEGRDRHFRMNPFGNTTRPGESTYMAFEASEEAEEARAGNRARRD